MSRKLTKAEKMLGRSECYHSMSAEDQWAEDKLLDILDWDGTEKEAKKLSGQTGVGFDGNMRGVKSVCYVPECFTLSFCTTFKGKDGYERSLSVTGIDSLETAKAMALHMGWRGEIRVSE